MIYSVAITITWIAATKFITKSGTEEVFQCGDNANQPTPRVRHPLRHPRFSRAGAVRCKLAAPAALARSWRRSYAMANFELDASYPFEAKDTGETCTSKTWLLFLCGRSWEQLPASLILGVINEGTRKRGRASPPLAIAAYASLRIGIRPASIRLIGQAVIVQLHSTY